MDKNIKIEDPEVLMLQKIKESGYNYRKRRQEEWRENYTLYRDRVSINRLTQRQSVNIPLMKQVIRTLLKDVDDMPVLYFENRDNDKQKEVFQNEYWKWTIEQNKMELKDIVDKRQVFLSGRTFDQMQIRNGRIEFAIQDVEDMLIDRYTDSTDIDTARFLVHTHIFVPLSTLEQNPNYDKKAVAELKKWYATDLGLIKSAQNAEMLTEKNKKMADMGLSDIDDPVLGETHVELSISLMYRDKEKRKGEYFEDQLFMYVDAENMQILQKAPLEEIIGSTKDNYWQTHFPYNSWGDDLEKQDFWSDGIADIIRTPNKVLNSWFSQLVENRTLRNFGMHYYDSTIEGFNPTTFNPVPWGWYGLPGKPADIMQKVDIPDLSESLDEMKYVVEMMEKATGATPTQQGVQTDRQITLGEVQLALGEAKERVKGMSKFYTPAWKARGEKFLKLIEAASDKIDVVKIYKEGRNTSDIYSREIEPKDWMTQSGYGVKIWSQDEKDQRDINTLQKLQATLQLMPGNPKLIEINQRKSLEFADLSPEEINEVMEIEQQKRDAMMEQAVVPGEQIMAQPQQPQQQPQARKAPNVIK